ncbi:MAG TPA: CheR family methyltransferase [Thermoanaerobaculia bacterium]|nr:CheR family methyltransferase [Thermoanaerobaculia bacterium]
MSKRRRRDEPASAAEAGPVIVGIGASAGGFDALSRLLPQLPAEGLAYVIVQHLAPDQTERFLHTLREHSRRSIELVRPGLRPEAGCVYLAPAHTLVQLANGRFLLAKRSEPPRPLLPIDYFLFSLANGPDGPGIGVALSGMGSDGVAGLREIKAAGGVVIAQEPSSAEYQPMPRAVIDAGLADLVLTPEQIAAELPSLAERLALRGPHLRPPDDGAEMPENSLGEVFERLRAFSGVDFSSYKLGTVRRRLQRRMVLNKLESLDGYVRLLADKPDELKELYQDLLINVTRFFRDPDSFTALQDEVFPKLFADRRHDDPVRVWVPGCSTGEEAYSTAIALFEHLGERASSYQVQIFATDLSESAVGVARAGLYPDGIREQISAERLQRFFTPTDGGFRVAKAVRDLCVFTRHDLTRDPPFSHLDLVMCRNVLIYLGTTLQKRVISVLHYALKPDGFLVLGAAESVGSRGDLFRLVDKRHSIYVKKHDAARGTLTLPRPYPGVDSALGRGRPSSPLDAVSGQVDRLLLERFAPAAVIVDSQLNILQTRGQTGHFLELAAGEANLNLLRMAREGLAYALRSALHEARQGDRAIRKEGLSVRFNGDHQRVNLEVVPFGTGAAENRHFLVLFEEAATAPASGKSSAKAAGRSSGTAGSGRKVKGGTAKRATAAEELPPAQMQELQDELAGTRTYLQSMIQDLEAANEELQSANEEILSSNEELQSTNEELDTAKEELQSTNEELHTLNEELLVRNDELARANSDLTNLLGSMQMAVVMVDNDLRIRRFTPAAEKLLNLIPGDVGRPIGHIKPNVDCPDLEDLIRRVITETTAVEREVRGPDQSWYELRVRSYKNHENRIDGAVLSLLDIEQSKAHQREATDARRLADEVLQAIDTPLALIDAEGRLRSANHPFARLLGLRDVDAIGRRFEELAPEQWNGGELRDLLAKHGRRQTPAIAIPGDGGGAPARRLVARRIEIEGEEAVLLSVVDA